MHCFNLLQEAKKRASARGPPGNPCHLRSPTLASALASVKRDYRDSRGKPSAGTFQGREGHVSPPHSGTHPSHKMPHCVHQRTGGGARMGASRPATRYTGTVACHGRFRDSECLVAVLFGAYWVAPLLRLAAGCPAQPCAPPPPYSSPAHAHPNPRDPLFAVLCARGAQAVVVGGAPNSGQWGPRVVKKYHGWGQWWSVSAIGG